MNIVKLAIFGKIILYLLQIFDPAKDLVKKSSYAKKLFECDLCLGVWIYTFLAYYLKIDVFVNEPTLINSFITGSAISFIVHLISIGWREKFNVIMVE